MRKIILSMMISIDGFIETADKDISWHNWSPEMDEHMSAFFKRIDTIILGRTAYELMASYWPTPAAGSENPLIAHKMNKLQKLVFSSGTALSEWRNTSFIKTVDPTEIEALKQQNGKDMVLFGGAKIARAFIDSDLIDEYQLIINPVLLGSGTPLFGKLPQSKENLILAESISTTTGNVILHYKCNHHK